MSKNRLMLQGKFKVGAVAVLLGGAMLLGGCGGDTVAEVERGTAVEVATAANGSIVDQTVVRGNVAAADDVYVVPKASGVVRTVNVQVGDYVTKGQSLCQIDTVDLQTSLALAQSQYNTLYSSYQTAVKNLERYRALYAEGAVSLAQLEQAESAVTSMGLDSVRLQVQSVQDQINNCNVKSTINGVVAEVNVNPGDMAGGGYVARVVDVSKVKLAANVTETLVACLSLGQELPVYIDSASSEPFVGVVTAIPVAANATMTYPVEITIDNSDGRIMAGMFAEVDVVKSKVTDSLIIPKGAVDSSDTVYVVEGDTARAVTVETGLSDDDNIEIVSGLKAGDVVVTAGAYLLEDGSRVRVVSDGVVDDAADANADADADTDADVENGENSENSESNDAEDNDVEDAEDSEDK